jgi:hypothetical protein
LDGAAGCTSGTDDVVDVPSQAVWVSCLTDAVVSIASGVRPIVVDSTGETERGDRNGREMDR